jgi:hypothetical protein
MGLISKCDYCGRRGPHTCFRGGTRTSIGFTDKDLKRAAEQIVYNEMQGKKGDARFKGVDKDLVPMLKFNGGDLKSALDQARSNYKGKKK